MFLIIFEGQGLGKNDDGISNPLKANYKFDQAGLGHNIADEMNNHWWERIYNKAANNIDINKNENEVTVQLKNGKSIEVINFLDFVFIFYSRTIIFRLQQSLNLQEEKISMERIHLVEHFLGHRL